MQQENGNPQIKNLVHGLEPWPHFEKSRGKGIHRKMEHDQEDDNSIGRTRGEKSTSTTKRRSRKHLRVIFVCVKDLCAFQSLPKTVGFFPFVEFFNHSRGCFF